LILQFTRYNKKIVTTQVGWFRVQGSGFRVQGSGFRVQGSEFRVHGSKPLINSEPGTFKP